MSWQESNHFFIFLLSKYFTKICCKECPYQLSQPFHIVIFPPTGDFLILTMLRKVTYILQQKYDLQKLLLLIVLMGFKLWFAINFDYFAQPFTDFHEIWRSFFNNTSQYCFTQEASQQNHFIYSLHCLFTWHSVVKWFCHVKNKSI